MKLKNAVHKTRIEKLYKYQIEKIVDLSIDWCIKNLGVRKWCPNFFVEVVKEDVEYGAGWYIPNRHDPEITINANANTTIIDLIDTVVHEYTHYLQPNFQEQYSQFSTEYEYFNNPLEIEARENGKKYRRQCFNDIKYNIRHGKNR